MSNFSPRSFVPRPPLRALMAGALVVGVVGIVGMMGIASAHAAHWYEDHRAAKEALGKKEWAKAAELLERAIRAKPESGLAQRTYGMAFVDYFPHLDLGIARFHLGAYREAIEAFDREEAAGAIRGAPARLEELRSFRERARKAMAPPPAADETEPPRLLDEARRLSAAGRLDEAIALLENGARTHPKVAALATELDRLRGERERETRRSELERRGRELANERRWSEAAAALRDAQALRSTNDVATLLVAVETEANRELDAATRVERAKGLLADAEREESAGAFDRALAATREALALDPRNDAARRLESRLVERRNEASTPASVAPAAPATPSTPIEAIPSDRDRPPSRVPIEIEPAATGWISRAVGLTLLVVLAVAIPWTIRIRRRRAARQRRFNPYVVGSPVLSPSGFVGRQDLLDRVISTVPNNSVMLYGERRIGKTSLQHQLFRRLRDLDDPVWKFFPVYVDLQGVPEHRFFATLAEDVFGEIEKILGRSMRGPVPPESIEYDDRVFVADLRRLVPELQKETHRRVKLVFLIDEVDELNGYDPRINQRLRSLFMKSFSESLAAVVSGVGIDKRWSSEGSPWYNFFEEMPVKPFSRAEGERLVVEPVRGFIDFAPGAVDRILDLTESKPYLIQKLCAALVSRLYDRGSRMIFVDDVDAIGRLSIE